MRLTSWLLVVALTTPATAQNDPISYLVPYVFSVYTAATSLVASLQSAASASIASAASATQLSATSRPSSVPASTTPSTSSTATTSTTPSSASSTAASSTPTSTQGTSTSPTSSNLATSSSPSIAAATSTPNASTAPADGSGGGNSKLAIILGCVLGGLALGLLILLLLLLCRRRRRRNSRALHRGTRAPDDTEVESWRLNGSKNVSDGDFSRSEHYPPVAAAAVPVMTENRHSHSGRDSDIPFVPMHPAHRRTAPNSRAGLTDGMVPGQEPFLNERSSLGPTSSHDSNTLAHHHHGAPGPGLAGTAGAAAVGAAAMHHHDRQHQANQIDDKNAALSTPAAGLNRKPIPIGPHSMPKESSPVYSSDSPSPGPGPVQSGALSAAPAVAPAAVAGRRRSGEQRRRSLTRDAVRANAAFDQQYSHTPPPTSSHHHRGGVGAGAAGLAAGAVGGAAIAHHRDRRNSTSTSRSPHRRSLLGNKNRDSDHSNSSETSDSYRDALTAQSNGMDNRRQAPVIAPVATQPTSMAATHVDHDPYDIPPTPPTRSRPNSLLGTAAPAAAVYSYHGDATNPRRSSSRESQRMNHPLNPVSTSNPTTGPTLPGRSPKRLSFQDPHENAIVDDNDHGYFDNVPYTAQHTDAIHGQPPTAAGPKGLVGDSRYPHMGVPHRRSGGEYDMERHGPLGPPSVLQPQQPPNPIMGSSTDTSDDSTWRTSQGLPGGWTRGESTSRRSSMDSRTNRQPGFPAQINPPEIVNQPYSEQAYGPVPPPPTTTPNGGRRLRLSDIQQQDEIRGRKSMETEWIGNDVYDGYSHRPNHHHNEHGGVGQAL